MNIFKQKMYTFDVVSFRKVSLFQNPLANKLNSTNFGFNIKHQKIKRAKIKHLYMDDIKIYAATEIQLK